MRPSNGSSKLKKRPRIGSAADSTPTEDPAKIMPAIAPTSNRRQ